MLHVLWKSSAKTKVNIVTRLVLQRGLMFQVKVLRQRETWQLWRRAFAQNIKRLYNKYLTTWQYTNLVTCYGCILQIFGGTPTPKLWPWTHSGSWQPCLVNSEWLYFIFDKSSMWMAPLACQGIDFRLTESRFQFTVNRNWNLKLPHEFFIIQNNFHYW